jgi:hypothetical protein
MIIDAFIGRNIKTSRAPVPREEFEDTTPVFEQLKTAFILDDEVTGPAGTYFIFITSFKE